MIIQNKIKFNFYFFIESTITSDYINQAARDLKWYKRMFWILLLSLIIVICLYFSSQNKILNLEEEKNDLYNKYVDMINEIIGTIEKNNGHLISIIENNNRILKNKLLPII